MHPLASGRKRIAHVPVSALCNTEDRARVDILAVPSGRSVRSCPSLSVSVNISFFTWCSKRE